MNTNNSNNKIHLNYSSTVVKLVLFRKHIRKVIFFTFRIFSRSVGYGNKVLFSAKCIIDILVKDV